MAGPPGFLSECRVLSPACPVRAAESASCEAGGRAEFRCRDPSPLPGARRRATVQAMNAAAWMTMVGIMAFVWGGFFLAVRRALRREARKALEGGGRPRPASD